jgi:hypothetical protein
MVQGVIMAFVLNPTRKFTAVYKDETTGDSFEADFAFLLTEDCFTPEMREKAKSLEVILESDTPEIKQEKLYKAQAVIWYKLRNSLKEVRGINDEQGNKIQINNDTRDAVFEFVMTCGDVSTQVVMAYIGVARKN